MTNKQNEWVAFNDKSNPIIGAYYLVKLKYQGFSPTIYQISQYNKRGFEVGTVTHYKELI